MMIGSPRAHCLRFNQMYICKHVKSYHHAVTDGDGKLWNSQNMQLFWDVTSPVSLSFSTLPLMAANTLSAFSGHQLGQGVLVQLSPSLIKRQKTHFHNLPCGASLILGNNGFVWLYPTPEQQDEEAGGFYTDLEVRTEPTKSPISYFY